MLNDIKRLFARMSASMNSNDCVRGWGVDSIDIASISVMIFKFL